MSEAPTSRARPSRLALDPWLWSARVDLSAFAGAALMALALAASANALGITDVSDAWWLILVLGIDVAHVHATWFRTYFDAEELARRRLRYVAVPTLVYIAGVLAYHASALVFWRVLAYLAIFHFVRQQAGWVALYRARGADRESARARWIDQSAVYAATLFPLFYWHAYADTRAFSWLIPGDIRALPLAPWVPVAATIWASALAVFFARELWRAFRSRALALGKLLVVASTAVTWSAGIVFSNSDFVFTATNVIPHGAPYLVLLYAYARNRALQRPDWSFSPAASSGAAAFVGVLLALAFVEELAWDRFVDHDRAWLFGSGVELGPVLLAFVVPLLALPQATHYVLDALLWRRAETRELGAQRAALGLPLPDATAPRASDRGARRVATTGGNG